MTDTGIFITLTAVLLIMQFAYRVWDKKDNKQILDAMAKGISSFEPHIERTKKVYGIVKGMKDVHSIRDEDGRPLIYMPKEIIDTQRELVKLTHTVATTQKHMVELLDRMDAKLVTHGDSCKEQFNILDKKQGAG